MTDPRGYQHTVNFDSRGRITDRYSAYGTSVETRTQVLYDAAGNVTEVRLPRHFDATDSAYGAMKQTFTYTGRNLLKTKTDGAGTGVAGTEEFTYSPGG